MSLVDDSSTATSTPSSTFRSRWGEKLKALKPFPQKARHISEFYIQPDDPHRQHVPGDIATGNVILKAVKPLDITHIVICLHGFAQVYKTPNNPGEGYRNYNEKLVNGRTNRAGGYYGNGFVSLFEDEVVLCGDGRLGEGTYQFGYELHFPRGRIPSSIDFERGTITYQITCTLTRPSRASIISPTQFCEKRLKYLDDINIALLADPRPRTITLSPVRIRRARTKTKKAPEPMGPLEQTQSPNNTLSLPSPPPTERSRSHPMVDLGVAQNEPPRSPGPSETSFESIPSSGGTPSAEMSQSAITYESNLQGRMAAVPVPIDPFKPVEITIMLDSSGYLRGDTIHIHVVIDHTKHVKSLHGVIATLYRKARLNYYPELPMVDSNESNLSGRRIVRGLSISPGGSYHTYQKPLDQNFAAIIIDPLTLKTDIKTSLVIPEDAFPSISNVPGAMMTFKYYVEILCDVQGKLSAYDKKLPTPGISSLNGMRHGAHSNGAHMGYRGWSFIDTEELLREKTVLANAFEVVVGTRDSNRGGEWSTVNAHNETVLDDQEPETTHSNKHPSPNSANMARQPSNRSQTSRPTTSCNNSKGEGPSNSQPHSHHPPDSPPPQFDSAAPDYQSLDMSTPSAAAIPIPTVPDESTLTEKERIRLAEQRLLPSAPPADPDTETDAACTPSAPTLNALEPLNRLNAHHHQHPTFPAVLPIRNSSSAPTPTASTPHLSAPPYESSATQRPEDDKQELEHRRLEALRSELPSTHHVNESEAHSSSSTERTEIPNTPVSNDSEEYTPTAPVFNEDEAMFGFRTNVGEALPKYER